MAEAVSITTVLQRRFRYSAAEAKQAVALLSIGDRDAIELALRHPGANAQIGAILMSARIRAAKRLRGRRQIWAFEEASWMAARDYLVIDAEPLPLGPQHTAGGREPRHALREVACPESLRDCEDGPASS